MKRGVALAVQILLNIFLFAGLAGVMYLCYLSGGGLTAGIVLLIAYALSLVLMPALHEAGHLLLGAAAGFRLAELRFSFVRILREGNGYSLQFVNPLSFDAAGCCRMYPAKNSDMGTRFAWFVAGGILVQAVYILLALTLSFALNLPMVWATLGVSCVYACYLFLVNVLPFEGSEGVYDGALLWGVVPPRSVGKDVRCPADGAGGNVFRQNARGSRGDVAFRPAPTARRRPQFFPFAVLSLSLFSGSGRTGIGGQKYYPLGGLPGVYFAGGETSRICGTDVCLFFFSGR